MKTENLTEEQLHKIWSQELADAIVFGCAYKNANSMRDCNSCNDRTPHLNNECILCEESKS
jgi:hypothetical protein